MTYFFKETKANNIVNSLFITDSDRICQTLRDLKAFQVAFNHKELMLEWHNEEEMRSNQAAMTGSGCC
jgi:hypothetical protein